MIKQASTLAVAAMTMMLAPGAAWAAPAESGDSYAVRIATGDLDLASRAGQATLHGRIGRAADVACGRSPVVPLADAVAVNACRAALARSAEARVALTLRAGDTRFAGTR